MKTRIVIWLLAFFVNLAAAQTKDASPTQVPATVKESFTKEHPGITPSWKADGKNYKAFYTDPKTNMSQLLVYDDKGNVLRRESELDKLNYPASISDYQAKNFPGEEFRIWSVQDKTGVNTYYSERNNQIIWFDQNGNFIAPKEKNIQRK